MYFHLALSQSGVAVEGSGYCGLWIYNWGYLYSGYRGNVLSGGCICLYVIDVPYDLRNSFTGIG